MHGSAQGGIPSLASLGPRRIGDEEHKHYRPDALVQRPIQHHRHAGHSRTRQGNRFASKGLAVHREWCNERPDPMIGRRLAMLEPTTLPIAMPGAFWNAEIRLHELRRRGAESNNGQSDDRGESDQLDKSSRRPPSCRSRRADATTDKQLATEAEQNESEQQTQQDHAGLKPLLGHRLDGTIHGSAGSGIPKVPQRTTLTARQS
jgi:hypothetical protein